MTQKYAVVGGCLDGKYISPLALSKVFGLRTDECILVSTEAMLRGMVKKPETIIRPTSLGVQ